MKGDKICRTCLSDHGNFFDIYQTFDQISLAQMIQDITSLQITSLKDHTKSVCSACVEEVRRAHRFRIKCLQSHYTLIELKTEHLESDWSDDEIDADRSKEKNVAEESDDDCNALDYLKIEEETGEHTFSPASESISDRENEYIHDVNVENKKIVQEVNENIHKEDENYHQTNNSKKENKNEKKTIASKTPSAAKILQNNFLCTLCPKSFDFAISLYKHKRIVHGEKKGEKTHDSNESSAERSNLNGDIDSMTGKIYKCDHCKYSSKFKSSMRKHMKIHFGKKKIKCPKCPFVTFTLSLLKIHSTVHTTEKNFRCEWCEKTFKQASSLHKHKKKEHASKMIEKIVGIKKNYTCKICQKELSSLACLKSHLLIHTGEKPFVCDYCGSCFTEASSLRVHKKVKHLPATEVYKCDLCTYTSNVRSVLNKHVKTHEKNLKCPECLYVTNSTASLKNHSYTHSTEKNFQCTLCPKSFKLPTSLTRHVQVVHENKKMISDKTKKYVCEICQKGFAQKENLNSHQVVHTGEKPHVCQYCGKSFSERSTLSVHIKLKHLSDIEILKCDHCNYTTKVKSVLNKHVKRHFAEKNLECPHCDFVTSYNSALNFHIMRHFDLEKMFSCNICDYKCLFPGQLKKHAKTHSDERPFQCDICNNRFKCKYNHQKHLETHNTELKYLCPVCPYKTKSEDLLKRHMKTKCGTLRRRKGVESKKTDKI